MSAAAIKRRVPVLCTWGLSTDFGWGVYGLNLAQQWADDPDLRPIFNHPAALPLQIDPLRAAKLSRILKESDSAARAIRAEGGGDISVEGVVIEALGNRFKTGMTTTSFRVKALAILGAIFFEDSELNSEARSRAAKFELVIAGSSWNAEVLRAAGIAPVACVLQGIDPTLFHPAPRSGLFGGRFLVFSGGKLEPRKGQDLVLETFRVFAARHPDALLVTAWHSPWPKMAATVGGDRGLAPVTFNDKGDIDVARWAVDNGLKKSQVLDIGRVPNPLMPTVLREMNAALFMNRCEGGTNLVAMECMACGVPTILSANTGHLDLLREGTAIGLRRQGKPHPPPRIRGIEGWGESETDEAVEVLEKIYVDREFGAETGRRGAALLAGMSWERQIGLLKDAIRPFLRRTPPASAALDLVT